MTTMLDYNNYKPKFFCYGTETFLQLETIPCWYLWRNETDIISVESLMWKDRIVKLFGIFFDVIAKKARKNIRIWFEKIRDIFIENYSSCWKGVKIRGAQ